MLYALSAVTRPYVRPSFAERAVSPAMSLARSIVALPARRSSAYTKPLSAIDHTPFSSATPTLSDIVNAYGTLTYYNRTGHVVTFDIEIPVKVTYKWGTITVWVKGTVNRTLNN